MNVSIDTYTLLGDYDMWLKHHKTSNWIEGMVGKSDEVGRNHSNFYLYMIVFPYANTIEYKGIVS